MKKLTISVASTPSNKFQVMINPATIVHNHAIRYTNDSNGKGENCLSNQGQGTIGSEAKFDKYEQETLKFDFILDGTGVVPTGAAPKPTAVDDNIAAFKKIALAFDGKQHSPNVILIQWGSLSFKGVLKTLDIDYTLFNSSGNPIRAKLSCSFGGYMSNEEESKTADRSSPDLTHRIVFKAGDSLPLLCYQIYRDSSYYREVARINGLSHFRHIKPGTTLQFPPLS